MAPHYQKETSKLLSIVQSWSRPPLPRIAQGLYAWQWRPAACPTEYLAVLSLWLLNAVSSAAKVFPQKSPHLGCSYWDTPPSLCPHSSSLTHLTKLSLSGKSFNCCTILLLSLLVGCCFPVAKLCPTPCSPMDWSTPGFPVFTIF